VSPHLERGPGRLAGVSATLENGAGPMPELPEPTIRPWESAAVGSVDCVATPPASYSRWCTTGNTRSPTGPLAVAWGARGHLTELPGLTIPIPKRRSCRFRLPHRQGRASGASGHPTRGLWL